MKTLYKVSLAGLASITMLSVGCKKSFLSPKPLSFYTPENTFINATGLNDALVSCARRLRNEYFDDNAPWLTETVFSEECVEGTDDKSGPAVDLNLLITPNNVDFNDADHARIQYYWNENYKGIKYANTVATRIDAAKWTSDAQRNLVLGSAYFYRALCYYRLCNQFGDVPTTFSEVNTAKVDFYTTKREVILARLKTDLEFAAKWGSDAVNKGEVTEGAINHLLTKVNLALGLFDDAIASATAVINNPNYALMTTRFGAYASDPTRDVIYDLHRPENKTIPANKEGLFFIIDHAGLQGGAGSPNSGTAASQIMRNCVPQFYATSILTPNGNVGMSDNATIEIPISQQIGRGIGRNRETSYSTEAIWSGANEVNDLRHAPSNFYNMSTLVYNNPNLKTLKKPDGTPNPDPYYGKHLQLYNDAGKILASDTLRTWFSWPYYKFWVPDLEHTPMTGGHTDWYVFRLAGTYLLRAEAYWWKGDPGSAMQDINKIRARANAGPLTNSGAITMATILDERARELFWEEPRKTELTRIAFLFAKTGKVSEINNGKTYTEANFATDNYFYDRIMAKNIFYQKQYVNNHGDKYTISPYHVLWPVPQSAIRANTQGHINQNKGYSGSESNVPALTTIPQ